LKLNCVNIETVNKTPTAPVPFNVHFVIKNQFLVGPEPI